MEGGRRIEGRGGGKRRGRGGRKRRRGKEEGRGGGKGRRQGKIIFIQTNTYSALSLPVAKIR